MAKLSKRFREIEKVCEDCFVAYGCGSESHEHLFASEVIFAVKETEKHMKIWIDDKMKNLPPICREWMEEVEGRPFIQLMQDKYFLFEFCPQCGWRIDWNALVPEPETSLPEKGSD